jgi:hypothetical protein
MRVKFSNIIADSLACTIVLMSLTLMASLEDTAPGY